MTTYTPAAIDNDLDFAADCARRAAALRAKAARATDWTERDRLARVAAALQDDAEFWNREARADQRRERAQMQAQR
jgi:hypothetical protein